MVVCEVAGLGLCTCVSALGGNAVGVAAFHSPLIPRYMTSKIKDQGQGIKLVSSFF